MAPGVLLSEDSTMVDIPAVTAADHPPSSPPNGAPAVEATQSNKVALDDMFDDDEIDDNEIMSSLKPTDNFLEGINRQNSSPSDPHVMRAFYANLFPFRYLFQWLNHEQIPKPDFMHREFAFTLPNDAYLRYQSFPTADLLRKQCVDMIPSRFEIGPQYSSNPRDRKQLRKATLFRPLAKELVFDIDMTDYDSIRTCCSGASICKKCWTFITMAIKVIDAALKDDFGFKHVLWVYSGRRGAHAWVCDRRARELDDSKRRAVATYLELLKGGDQGGKKVNLKRPLHPHIERSLRLLRDHFQTDVLTGQNPWESDSSAAHLLKQLPDSTLSSALRKKWDAAPGRSSTAKWADIDALAASGSGSASLDGRALRDAKVDVLLEYTYPRLDAEVSKKLNHLLKSPFCVHPGTGRVCVPIDVRDVEGFDPLAAPHVVDLLAEMEQFDRREKERVDREGGEKRKMPEWEKTSLKVYVEFFKGFVANLLRDERIGAAKRKNEDGDKMEF